MDKFTASNGLEIETQGVGGAHYIWENEEFGGIRSSLTPDEVQALREFFRAEEDERLGRWRHPDFPDWTVYDDEGALVLFNEVTKYHAEGYTRRAVEMYPGEALSELARAYFDAHPERKPWHDAKPGEVWLLTLNGEPGVPAVVSSSSTGFPVFTAATIEAQGTEEMVTISTQVTAGHRIWPQD